MSIQIRSTKGISQRKSVVEIVNIIKDYPVLFRYIARLLSVYKDNSVITTSEIEKQINNYLNDPRLSIQEQIIVQIKLLLLNAYNEDSKEFQKVRSEILENCVHLFGPFFSVPNIECYIEPEITDTLKDSTEVIGGSNIKCDFVYFTEESEPLEFIECKTDIVNVIPKTLPFDRVSTRDQKKIIYLENAFNYLTENYCKPFVYFACYNLNFEESLKNLQENWGQVNMGIINAEEIIKKYV